MKTGWNKKTRAARLEDLQFAMAKLSPEQSAEAWMQLEEEIGALALPENNIRPKYRHLERAIVKAISQAKAK